MKTRIGSFKNLIDIKSLSTGQICEIIDLAESFEIALENKKVKSNCCGKNLAFLFFENSTRTRFSFEMACHNLGVRIFNFNADTSSVQKGENLVDTVENLWAIGINGIVLRHSNPNVITNTESGLKTKIPFINAGNGCVAHPTQALLDYYTMKKHLGTLEGRNVTIIGDISHSRVAKSNIELLSRFGVNITCCAPNYFKDKAIKNVKWSENLKESLQNADVTMCLRIQKERIEKEIPLKDYIENFQVNEKNISKKTLLMHPGPANRDIEVSSKLLDGKMGQTILEQAKNGVFVRMAVLDLLLGGGDNEQCH